jgi:hypothetical protein
VVQVLSGGGMKKVFNSGFLTGVIIHTILYFGQYAFILLMTVIPIIPFPHYFLDIFPLFLLLFETVETFYISALVRYFFEQMSFGAGVLNPYSTGSAIVMKSMVFALAGFAWGSIFGYWRYQKYVCNTSVEMPANKYVQGLFKKPAVFRAILFVLFMCLLALPPIMIFVHEGGKKARAFRYREAVADGSQSVVAFPHEKIQRNHRGLKLGIKYDWYKSYAAGFSETAGEKCELGKEDLGAGFKCCYANIGMDNTQTCFTKTPGTNKIDGELYLIGVATGGGMGAGISNEALRQKGMTPEMEQMLKDSGDRMMSRLKTKFDARFGSSITLECNGTRTDRWEDADTVLEIAWKKTPDSPVVDSEIRYIDRKHIDLLPGCAMIKNYPGK